MILKGYLSTLLKRSCETCGILEWSCLLTLSRYNDFKENLVEIGMHSLAYLDYLFRKDTVLVLSQNLQTRNVINKILHIWEIISQVLDYKSNSALSNLFTQHCLRNTDFIFTNGFSVK